MHIKIILREKRKQLNITVSQLSKMTGISESQIRYIERNEKDPAFSKMILIAKALKVNIEELYKIEK